MPEIFTQLPTKLALTQKIEIRLGRLYFTLR